MSKTTFTDQNMKKYKKNKFSSTTLWQFHSFETETSSFRLIYEMWKYDLFSLKTNFKSREFIKQKNSPSHFGWSANAGISRTMTLQLHSLSYSGNGNDKNCWKSNVCSPYTHCLSMRILANQSKIWVPLSNRIKVYLVLKSRPDI